MLSTLSIRMSMLDIIHREKYNLFVDFSRLEQKMKKTLRILLPIILALAILLCLTWYLFIYDREFTRDLLLDCARYCEDNGNHAAATWFYNRAYYQANDNDAVAIELAEQYMASGNYTKAEFTLSNAIADGGGVDLYIALCKTYIQQDKLLDAVTMLGNITNPKIKSQLDQLRPKAPVVAPEPGFYNQYISVSIEAENGTLYVSADGKYPSTHTAPCTTPINLNEGENTLYAIVVSESGLVSPLSVYGYTVGGVVKAVTFSDPAMEASVRNVLNISEDKPVYTNDLWKITDFTVPTDAQVYSDLAYMTYLERLTIQSGQASQLTCIAPLATLTELKITDVSIDQETLSMIAALPKLKKLTLSNCSLASISPLASAQGLVNLDLSQNTIRNIDALSNISGLQELNLQHNAVVDLTALSKCDSLTKLDVSYNALTSLSPICNLSGLTWLNAERNSILSLEDMSRLTALKYLSLSHNGLTSIGNLSTCTGLTELFISNNALTDISSLSSLTGLMYFDFSYNQVTDIPTWSESCALVSIDGSHNLISVLDVLSGLKQLNNVYMDYNAEVSSVDKLASCPMLIQVNVYGTKVTDVSALTAQSVIVNYNPVNN